MMYFWNVTFEGLVCGIVDEVDDPDSSKLYDETDLLGIHSVV